MSIGDHGPHGAQRNTAPRARGRRHRAPLLLGAAAATLVISSVIYLVASARQDAGSAKAASGETMTGTTQEKRKPNRLFEEKSPYLLQHAYNPVDWYPWGDEAFAKARAESKPIFLSIGYSTCHWCHVMERESFENDSIADLLNRYFVSIKVDREERPDVDRLYMNAVQAMGAGGGWPLNVFLTPDLDPFFGGTYFPPSSRHGRLGMMELLPRIHEVWTARRSEIEEGGQRIMRTLESLSEPDTVTRHMEELFAGAYAYFEGAFDAERGGFGPAPRFPSTVNLSFLLRYWASDPEPRKHALTMALRQLDAMRAAGIHDHLGGGFHRYATDADWMVPHFEKMLYDQAQLAWSYLEAYQISGKPEYAETARGIFTYVSRDLSSPEGGFYSAEDADSEGEEGKFYVWTPNETAKILGADLAALFDAYYGVTEQGNFENQASIVHEAASLADVADAHGLTTEAAASKLAQAKAKLLEARGKRVRPHLDDKILVAWNGLMISAYARGARVLDDPALAARAAQAANFIWRKLHDERTGSLTRRWREGEAAGAGQLDDHAYLALGMIDLYEATFDPVWLKRAIAVTEAQIARFWDEKDGGFFESPADDPHVKIRMKDGFDGAEIAGNSIAALNLQTLGVLLDREEWLTKAKQTFDYFTTRLASGPAAMPQMLVAMDLAAATPRHIVIAGKPGAADTRGMIGEFNRRFLPHDALLLVDRGAWQKQLSSLAPFTEPLTTKDGMATAYVCVNYACKLPTTDVDTFAAQLDERTGGAPTGGIR